MRPNVDHVLSAYNGACWDLAYYFAKIYFKEFSQADIGWVSEDVGGVLCIGDYYFDMDNIVCALRNGVGVKRLFEWYDWSIEQKEFEHPSLYVYLNQLKIKKSKE